MAISVIIRFNVIVIKYNLLVHILWIQNLFGNESMFVTPFITHKQDVNGTVSTGSFWCWNVLCYPVWVLLNRMMMNFWLGLSNPSQHVLFHTEQSFWNNRIIFLLSKIIYSISKPNLRKSRVSSLVLCWRSGRGTIVRSGIQSIP